MPRSSQGLESLLKGAAIEEHPTSAFQALYSYIRADPHNSPLVASTGVRLAQPRHIPHSYVDRHAAHLKAVAFTLGALRPAPAPVDPADW